MLVKSLQSIRQEKTVTRTQTQFDDRKSQAKQRKTEIITIETVEADRSIGGHSKQVKEKQRSSESETRSNNKEANSGGLITELFPNLVEGSLRKVNFISLATASRVSGFRSL